MLHANLLFRDLVIDCIDLCRLRTEKLLPLLSPLADLLSIVGGLAFGFARIRFSLSDQCLCVVLFGFEEPILELFKAVVDLLRLFEVLQGLRKFTQRNRRIRIIKDAEE